MKKICKVLAVLAVVSFSVMEANAQERFGSIGIELGLPIGDFGDFFGPAIGASAGYEFGLTDKIAIGANLGYTLFTGKDIDVLGTTIEGESQGFTIVQAYGRYYFNEARDGFFAGAMFGWHITSYDDFDGRQVNEANFGLAPEVGFFVTENISLSLRYQMIFAEGVEFDPVTFETSTTTVTNSYIGLRAAFNF